VVILEKNLLSIFNTRRNDVFYSLKKKLKNINFKSSLISLSAVYSVLFLFKALVSYLLRRGLKLFFEINVRLFIFYLRVRLIKLGRLASYSIIEFFRPLKVAFRFNFWRKSRKQIYMPFLVGKSFEWVNSIRNFYKFIILKRYQKTNILSRLYLIFLEFVVTESFSLVDEMMERLVFSSIRDNLIYLKNSQRFRISYRNLYNNRYYRNLG
jgi:hypothetical protein